MTAPKPNAMRAFSANMLLLAAIWQFLAWVVMVAVGNIHADFLPQVPTIGYGSALLITTVVPVILLVREAYGRGDAR